MERIVWQAQTGIARWCAAAYAQVGVAGLLGTAMVVVALASLAVAWQEISSWRDSSARDASGVATAVSPNAEPGRSKEARTGSVSLPAASDIPLLLAHVERAAVANGLGWPQASYRVVNASDDTPAHLEVRFDMKGPYLGIRRFIADVHRELPTATWREFRLSRPDSTTAVVDGKFVLVVYLASVETASPLPQPLSQGQR